MRRMLDRGDAPASLADGEQAATQALLDLRAKGGKLAYSGLYAAPDVREALEGLQNGVCVYCEASIAPVCIGHIEHFRPKGAVKNEMTGRLMKPGYFWLAYKWENLMLACEHCNVQKKGFRYPLRIEVDRAREPGDDVDLELPILIDPYAEEPRDYIRFNRSVAISVDADGRGQEVIDFFDLNGEVERFRRLRLQELRALRIMMIYDKDPIKRAEATDTYNEYLSGISAFSSCIADNPIVL